MKVRGTLQTLRFMVAGTGRNGSRWISEVMTGLGLLCGHERFSHSAQPFLHEYGNDFVGDASFQCVPHLRAIRKANPEIVIFHQLRDPVGYVTSIMGAGGFENSMKTNSPHGKYQMKYVIPEIEPGDRVTTAMRMWAHWNDMVIPYSHMRYRLEETTPYRIRDILAWLGERRSLEDIESAMESASRNEHPKTGEDYSQDIRQSPFYPEFRRAAEYYGYRI